MREGTPKKGYLFYNVPRGTKRIIVLNSVPRGTLLQLFSFISIIKTSIYFLDC
jgi:hypothetical protein